VSGAVRDEIAATFGHAEKIAVTPNGVDPVFTADGPRDAGRYFLFVGNEKPHKNVKRAIAAANSVGVQLIRAGSTRFVPSEELAALYRGAIALVMPSIEEGFGLPALEAMACGTAVITSNAPALVEITGDAAIHVDAMSVDAIANAMKRVMSDESARRTMIDAGLSRAKKFTWDRCAEMTREIYRRIA
ncbi:MAG TPA: glycosyltransferase family 1 protein, partial [Thermoanaerobaculia bacterium]